MAADGCDGTTTQLPAGTVDDALISHELTTVHPHTPDCEVTVGSPALATLAAAQPAPAPPHQDSMHHTSCALSSAVESYLHHLHPASGLTVSELVGEGDLATPPPLHSALLSALREVHSLRKTQLSLAKQRFVLVCCIALELVNTNDGELDI
jgi:hypothetical protein